MTQAASWAPDVEQRLHPFGEAGVTSSLEEVCKRVSRGAAGILGSGEQITRVRAWAIEQLHAARGAGERVVRPGDRARVLLEAVQKKKIWVPDPVGTEHIFDAKHLTCDDHDEYGVCVKGGDCDDVVTALAACFMSVGLYTMIVGHSYSRNQVIGHVLTKVYFEGTWHYADPSPLADGKYMPLGKCAPFTREMYYSLPEIRVVCDGETCDRQQFDPNELGFVQQGTFVGVNGIPVFEMPPRVEWLGEAQPIVEWLGETPAPAAEDAGYTGYDQFSDDLTQEIIKQGGSTSGSSMQAYAEVLGKAGGAAVCTAYGAGAAAPICAQLGGAIAKALFSGGKATAGNAYGLPDLWNNVTLPNMRLAQEGIIAVRSYLTIRDATIRKAAEIAQQERGLSPDQGLKWAANWLHEHFLPGAPLLAAWRPRADVWNTFSAFVKWAAASNAGQAPGDPPSYSKGSNYYKDWCTCSDCWGYKSATAKNVAASLGLTCKELLLLTWYPQGTMAAPGDAIDWGMVGAWEIVNRGKDLVQKNPVKEFGIATGQGSALLLLPKSAPIKAGVVTAGTGGGNEYVKADVIPSVLATELLLGLQTKRTELLKAAETATALSSASDSSASSAGGTIVKLGLGAGALWGAFTLLKYLKVFR